MFEELKRRRFLCEELVKRDFKKKYKRTILGMGWSILSPLLSLLVMRIVFSHFFASNIAHYTTYLFCGNLLFSYFSESTRTGMGALMSNAGIFSKVNIPKYLFLLSKNTSSLTPPIIMRNIKRTLKNLYFHFNIKHIIMIPEGDYIW